MAVADDAISISLARGLPATESQGILHHNPAAQSDLTAFSQCSGEDVCLHCRARDVVSTTAESGDRSGRRPQSDPRGASLEDRLALLQEEVRRVSEANPKQTNPSLQRTSRASNASNLTPYLVDLTQPLRDETDTFDLTGNDYRSLSLSSQLVALHELLSTGSAKARPAATPAIPDRTFPLELPRPSRLKHLLDIYFRDMDSFFPYLDQTDTEARIFQTLQSLGYSDYNLIVDIDFPRHPIAALLCNILAMGDCMDPQRVKAEDVRPGWPIYVRGRKLMHYFPTSKTVSLDLVRYHLLSALYMMHTELLQPALQAIGTTVQLAIKARLNNQAAWKDCPESEISARKKLWWTIYFFDRRIAQRNGSPYLIRDIEVAVEDFEPNLASPRLRNEPGGDPSRQSSHFTLHHPYFQVLINYAKLWGEIWDKFFAASAPKRMDWREVEIADTRVILVRRQLSSELTWDTDLLESYISDGETEPQLRRRLFIFIRINLLRMTIRQNPILSGESGQEARKLCAVLARDSVEAIAAFANACPGIRPSGYFISTALVECIYHLVYLLKDPGLQTDGSAALESFHSAYQLLVELAGTIEPANHALEALKIAISSSDYEIFGALGTESVSQEGDRVVDESIQRQDRGPVIEELPQHEDQQVVDFNLSNFSMHTPDLMMDQPESRPVLDVPQTMAPDIHTNFRHFPQETLSQNLDFMQGLANTYGDWDT
ncbi:uncharacterized protein BDZ99DRAFT_482811 [Mytilinidion resinicola]|uniref:Xylanolytic transcriptional activator regulatory domain-containing protein n=1 Tax=Mytilinidion resinicola TaxID=574789 RepID=A0A6A6Y0T0_9PEZI|nr:uncharacterized protein BDZ99DRAFT_482811 [Mytilinidion resinicola]KAF2802372.1 hypothetical protein BDZ99DRAFT_482811 [Mytilinidion resinicola]